MFVIFLLTGYYLEIYFKPEHLDNLTLRMEIRANHIYILFISFLNILAYKCNFTEIKKKVIYLEISFRILLITSGVMALYAFIYDHNGDLTGRNVTLTAVILSLLAVVIFLANELIHHTLKKQYESN